MAACVLLWLAPSAAAQPATAPGPVGATPSTEATSREGEWTRARQEKAKALHPYEPGRIERLLLTLERDRVIERLLVGADGFFPRIGTITSGSSLTLGPGYRRRDLLGGELQVVASAAVSLRKYWSADALVSLPRLARGRAFVDGVVRAFEYPQEPFFGLGPTSRRSDETTFALRDTRVGVSGGVRLAPWMIVGAGMERLSPRVGRGRSPRISSLADRFSAADVPGLDAQPTFLAARLVAEVDYREPRGNPRWGGRYLVRYSLYDDRDLDRYDFGRLEIDVQQYVPFFQQRRVVAFRGLASLASADVGRDVPFYLQETLGGSDRLRGFRRYRFRDRNLLLLQAEYRWEIFAALDAALFYEAGKVVPRREALQLRHLESDYGFGFRFGTRNGVFFRIDAGFGGGDGPHLFIAVHDVFAVQGIF